MGLACIVASRAARVARRTSSRCLVNALCRFGRWPRPTPPRPLTAPRVRQQIGRDGGGGGSDGHCVELRASEALLAARPRCVLVVRRAPVRRRNPAAAACWASRARRWWRPAEISCEPRARSRAAWRTSRRPARRASCDHPDDGEVRPVEVTARRGVRRRRGHPARIGAAGPSHGDSRRCRRRESSGGGRPLSSSSIPPDAAPGAREIALAPRADHGALFRRRRAGRLHPSRYRVPRDMIDTSGSPDPIRNHRRSRSRGQSAAIWTEHAVRSRVDRRPRFPHQSVSSCHRVKDRPVGGFFVIWWTERRTITDARCELLEASATWPAFFLERPALREAAETNRAKDEFLPPCRTSCATRLARSPTRGALERRSGARGGGPAAPDLRGRPTMPPGET